MEVPAEIIALIKLNAGLLRFSFDFIKQFFGGSQLMSHNLNGIEIRGCYAIIACLLSHLWTAHKPTKRTFVIRSYYLMGIASEERPLAHLAKLYESASS